MQGSGLSNWTLNFDILKNINQNVSVPGMMDNSTMLMDNIIYIELNCKQTQEEFGPSLQIPVSVENAIRAVQAIYFIINLVLGVLLNLLVIVLTLRFKNFRISHFSLVFRSASVIFSMVQL